MNDPAIDWERVVRAALPERTVERAIAGAGELGPAGWALLARAALHPLQVRAIEAFNHERLSVKDLARRERLPIANMAYHVDKLRKWGLLRRDGRVKVRGATKQFYRLAAVRIKKVAA